MAYSLQCIIGFGVFQSLIHKPYRLYCREWLSPPHHTLHFLGSDQQCQMYEQVSLIHYVAPGSTP